MAGLNLNHLSTARLAKLAEKVGYAQETLKPLLTFKNIKVAIFWDVVSGTLTLTDTGEYGANENLVNYTQRKTLFTGKDNLIIMPRDGVKIEPVYDEHGVFQKYKRVYLPTPFYRNAYVLRHHQGTLVNDSHLFPDVKQEQNIQTIDLLFEDFTFNENTARSFIQLPEITDNVLFRLVEGSVTSFVEGKQYITKATYQSVNDIFSSSGRAIDQYIHKGNIGECVPYYKVSIEDGKKVVKLDERRLISYPVTNYQVEIFGAAILNSVLLVGRPTANFGQCTPSEDLAPSTILFADKVLTPQTSYLTKKAIPTSTLYFFRRGHTDVRFYFKSLSDRLNSFYDEQTRPDTQGFFICEPPGSKVRNSAIYAMRKTTKTVNSQTGEDVPDPQGNTPEGGPQDGLAQDGSLPVWTVRSKAWDDYDVNLQLDGETKERLWCVPQSFLDMEKTHYDDAIYNYFTLPDTMKVHDLLNLNSLIYWDVYKLPVDYTTVNEATLGGLSLVGKMLSGVGLGIPSSFQYVKTWTPQKTIMGFVPSVLAEWATCYINNPGNRTLLPLGMFRNDTPDTSMPLVAPHTQNTTIRLSLTDQVKDTTNNEIYNVVDLGQDPAKFPDKKTWKYNPNKHIAVARSENVQGFYPDAIIIKSVAKANFRLSFFHNNTPLWQGRYQTESKWDGNDRSWTTTINLSAWGQNLDNKQSYPYPVPWNPQVPPAVNYQFNNVPNFFFTHGVPLPKEETNDWLKRRFLLTDDVTSHFVLPNEPIYPNSSKWTYGNYAGSTEVGFETQTAFPAQSLDYSQYFQVKEGEVYLTNEFFKSISFKYDFTCVRWKDLGKWFPIGGTDVFLSYKVEWKPDAFKQRYFSRDLTPHMNQVGVSYSYPVTIFIGKNQVGSEPTIVWQTEYEATLTATIHWDTTTPNKALFMVDTPVIKLLFIKNIVAVQQYEARARDALDTLSMSFLDPSPAVYLQGRLVSEYFKPVDWVFDLEVSDLQFHKF